MLELFLGFCVAPSLACHYIIFLPGSGSDVSILSEKERGNTWSSLRVEFTVSSVLSVDF